MQEIKFKTHVDNNVEDDVYRKITKEKFWMSMRDINVDFKKIMKYKNVLLDEIAKLNIEINRLNQENQMPMIDMVVMISEEEYIPVRYFIKILDSENMKILKKELIEFFKLKGHNCEDIDYLIT